MTNDLTYIFVDDNHNKLFEKNDRQSDNIPQTGEVLHLKHIKGGGEENLYGKVLMVVNSKHLWGFANIDDCAVQRLKTLIFVQKLEVNKEVEAYRQLLKLIGDNVALHPLQPTEEEAKWPFVLPQQELKIEPPKVYVTLKPTVYADGQVDIEPEVRIEEAKKDPRYEATLEMFPPVKSIKSIPVEANISEEAQAFIDKHSAPDRGEDWPDYGQPAQKPAELAKDDQDQPKAPTVVVTRDNLIEVINKADLTWPTKKKLKSAAELINIDGIMTQRRLAAVFNTICRNASVRVSTKAELHRKAEVFIKDLFE